MHSKFLIAVFFLVPMTFCFSQDDSAFGVMVGIANYQGDLSEKQITFSETKPALGFFVRRQFQPKWTMRGNLFVTTITGSDFNYATRVHRGLSFKSLVVEGGFMVEWDVFGHLRNDRRMRNKFPVTPYFSSGFGFTFFNPKVTGFSTANDANMEDDRRSKITFNVMIPIGAGLKYDVSDQYTFGVEFISHLPFTDYLDGVSLSGEPGNNDWYIFGGLTLQYWITEKHNQANHRGKRF